MMMLLYSTSMCQREDWKYHQAECAAFVRIQVWFLVLLLCADLLTRLDFAAKVTFSICSIACKVKPLSLCCEQCTSHVFPGSRRVLNRSAKESRGGGWPEVLSMITNKGVKR